MKNLKITLLKEYASILFICLLLSGCGEQIPSAPAMVSVSSDGKYVLSTHFGRYLILWDIEHKIKKILNKKASIYSPYFIKDSHNFLWQDFKSKEVFIQSVNGKVLKSINPGFVVYGHVIASDFSNYVASQDNWSLYQYKNGIKKTIKEKTHDLKGSARLMQLSLEKNLITSGNGSWGGSIRSSTFYPLNLGFTIKKVFPDTPEHMNYSLLNEVTLWDVASGKPIKKFLGNSGKTTSAISPDEKYVAAGDEQGFFYLWDTQFGKRTDLDDPVRPSGPCYIESCTKFRKKAASENRVAPLDFYSRRGGGGAKVAAVKFIDTKGNFLRFSEDARYATLYNVSSHKIQGFIDLGLDPHPTTFSLFDSANTIATAPKANILVMGQSRYGPGNENATGIIVYRFDEKNKKLIRLWAPDGPPRHRRIINPDDKWEG